jgi:site-specific recombinase XerD
MRALRKLQRASVPSPFVFTSEGGAPFATAGFAKLVERAGEAAGFAFKAHPHLLRARPRQQPRQPGLALAER